MVTITAFPLRRATREPFAAEVRSFLDPAIDEVWRARCSEEAER
jgi:hypothetical protein